MSEPMLRNGEANVEGTPPCSEHGRAPDEEAVEIERVEAPLPAAENPSADGSSYNACTRVVPPPAEPSVQLLFGLFGCCFGPPEAVLGKARRLAC
ncbi:hypothetical protein DIPPA_25379 [Diplonema papillatum]|nr:hypothetical protein DIPPA_25379 [Diplonema papillatum]